jgi:hypothetical protein
MILKINMTIYSLNHITLKNAMGGTLDYLVPDIDR